MTHTIDRRSLIVALTSAAFVRPAAAAKPKFEANRLSMAVQRYALRSIATTGVDSDQLKFKEAATAARILFDHYREVGLLDHIAQVIKESNDVFLYYHPSFSEREALFVTFREQGLNVDSNYLGSVLDSTPAERALMLELLPVVDLGDVAVEVMDREQRPPKNEHERVFNADGDTPPTEEQKAQQITFVANTMSLVGSLWSIGAFAATAGGAACLPCAGAGVAFAGVGLLIRVLVGGGGSTGTPKPESGSPLVDEVISSDQTK